MHVLRSRANALSNRFLTGYEWDEEQLNTERLDLLQQPNETRWSSDGVVSDDTVTHKTGVQILTQENFTITLSLATSSDRISSTHSTSTRKPPTCSGFISIKKTPKYV